MTGVSQKENDVTSTSMACNEFVELVTRYLEGVLSPEDRARLENHLTDCDPCSIYLEQMRRTIDLLGRLPSEDISPEVQAELLRAFRKLNNNDADA